jgi:predicted DNA-binding transcriptional regulator AlpA
LSGEPELLRVPQVAKILGVSVRVCYDLVGRSILPGVLRSGRRIFIRRRVLEAWLSGRDRAVGSGEGDGPAAQVGAGLSGGAP